MTLKTVVDVTMFVISVVIILWAVVAFFAYPLIINERNFWKEHYCIEKVNNDGEIKLDFCAEYESVQDTVKLMGLFND